MKPCGPIAAASAKGWLSYRRPPRRIADRRFLNRSTEDSFCAPFSGATPSPGAVASAVACPDRRLGIPTADAPVAPSTSAMARSRTIRATDHRLPQTDPVDGAGGWLLSAGALLV